MNLKILHTNRPTAFLGLILFQSLFYVNELFHLHGIPNSSDMPIYEVILSLQIPDLLGLFSSFTLVFLQALLFDFLLSRYNLYDKPSSYPGFFFILFNCIYPGFLQLNPIHIVNTLLLFNFWSLMESYKADKAVRITFNVGLLTSLAALFWFPAILLHVFNAVALIIIKPFRIREHFSALLGAIIPYLWTIVILFITESTNSFIPVLAIARPEQFNFLMHLSWGTYIMIGFVFILMNLALLNIFNDFVTYKIFSRRIYSVALIMPIFVLIGFLIIESFSGEQLLMLAFPFAILVARLFSDIRNPAVARIILALLFILMLFVQFEYYYGSDLKIKLIP